MSALAITAVEIPSASDGGTRLPGGAPDSATDFLECHALRETHELETWGNLDRSPTLAEAREYWRGSEYEERHLYIARLDGETVGLCSVTLPLRENQTTAGVDVLVVAARRRQSWGRQLLDYAEKIASERGRRSLYAYFEVPHRSVAGADRILPAKSGAGGLPLEETSTAFAASAGYELEQVERSSRLALPVTSEHLGGLEADPLVHAREYAIVGWAEACPDELVSQYAVLKARMSTDVPTAGLDWGAEDWSAARVRHEEQTLMRGGVESVVAAAVHARTGELAAYTVLTWRAGIPAAAIQQDTLVAGGHRGHRLGMLVKLANLRTAQQRWPAARSVITWNASENQHMLAINIALGFRPVGYEGEWQKRLG